MAVQLPHFPEGKREIAGGHRDGLQIGVFQIQVPSEVVIPGLVGYGCAHRQASLGWFGISIPQFALVYYKKEKLPDLSGLRDEVLLAQ